MAGGGLYDPLGTDRPARASRTGPSLSVIVLFGVLIGFASLFATAAFRDDGERGEPRAIARIGPARRSEPAPPVPPPSPSLASAGAAMQPSGPTGGSAPSSDQDVEIQNGVRVIRLRRNGATSGSLTVKVPAPTAAAAAPLTEASLFEPGSSGPLPKVGSDGRRPAEAYAGTTAPEAMGKPWVSILVESPGADAAAPATPDWPAAVTLGFGVDGPDLPRQVGSARAAGHEIVLMLPSRKGGSLDPTMSSMMGSSARPARDRLNWLLSRFVGYAGVVLATANQDGISVVDDVQEVTRRGLYVVDDAVTHAPDLPPAGRGAPLPITRADLVLAGPVSAEALEHFGDQLAALARANGSAIGIAPSSPQVLAAMPRLITHLADKGLALVPLSAVVNLKRNTRTRAIPVAAP